MDAYTLLWIDVVLVLVSASASSDYMAHRGFGMTANWEVDSATSCVRVSCCDIGRFDHY